MDEWAKHAELEIKVTKATALIESKAVDLPELPANLKRCLAASKVRPQNKAKPKAAAKADKKDKPASVPDAQSKSPSADALVLKQLEAQKRRQACAEQILKWYDGIRKSQAQKVAAVK